MVGFTGLAHAGYMSGLMSDTTVLLWVIALIGLEVQHLKWIVWNDWDCRTHGVKNRECRCKARLMLWL
jgi:hypothetical protein